MRKILESFFAEPPSKIVIQRVGDDASPVEITAAAGEDLELECIATGANPPAKLKWFMGTEEITSGIHIDLKYHFYGMTNPPSWRFLK